MLELNKILASQTLTGNLQSLPNHLSSFSVVLTSVPA